MQRHRYGEFIRFLNAVEREVPPGKLIHAVLDNYATHKHPKVLAWLSCHPRSIFDFTPTSASSLNAVESFLQDDPPTHPPRRLPLDCRSPDCHQRLLGRAQCQSQTLRLDQNRRDHA
jgi:hypothetical protein